MDKKHRNRCGSQINYPHFGASVKDLRDVPFETIAGPCTPLYDKKVTIDKIPQECIGCIYDELEESNGGINNCLDLCIDREEIKGACRDPWRYEDQTYKPTKSEWCELAKCVQNQRARDRPESQCKNPCRDLDLILFNDGALSIDDYCL